MGIWGIWGGGDRSGPEEWSGVETGHGADSTDQPVCERETIVLYSTISQK